MKVISFVINLLATLLLLEYSDVTGLQALSTIVIVAVVNHLEGRFSDR